MRMIGIENSQIPRSSIRACLRVLLIAVFVASTSPQGLDAQSGDRSTLKNYQHVFLIMMENTTYTRLIGNPNAPFINFAARTYGLATNYTGITHPSQPNYIASTSGSTNGVADDNDTTIDVPNIVDQLESHGKSWKEGLHAVVLFVRHAARFCQRQSAL
jgi:phosphatidylinositol-3-phosphatase